MPARPNPTGSELELLGAYLDVQREAMLAKTDGLDREQLSRRLAPSALTLSGLLYHVALVEESWTEERFAGLAPREPWASVDWDADPDWEFHAAGALEPDELRQRYRDACERSRAIVARTVADGDAGLDARSASTLANGERFSLRWVLLRLIEETARHAGHADLLREALDGSVGT